MGRKRAEKRRECTHLSKGIHPEKVVLCHFVERVLMLFYVICLVCSRIGVVFWAKKMREILAVSCWATADGWSSGLLYLSFFVKIVSSSKARAWVSVLLAV